MLWLLTPLAWPLGRLLDHLIPHGSQSISRREVTALVEVTLTHNPHNLLLTP
jgi:hypothetical protein